MINKGKKNIDIRSRFLKNIVQIIIGTILLFMVYGYLQNKDSEKRAFFGGFEIIGQKIYLGYLNIADPIRGKVLESKYEIEKSLDEMEIMSQSCSSDSNIIKNIEDFKFSIKSMSLEQFSSNLNQIRETRFSLFDSINLECKKNS